MKVTENPTDVTVAIDNETLLAEGDNAFTYVITNLNGDTFEFDSNGGNFNVRYDPVYNQACTIDATIIDHEVMVQTSITISFAYTDPDPEDTIFNLVFNNCFSPYSIDPVAETITFAPTHNGQKATNLACNINIEDTN